jgi:hypothetical protein
MWYSLMDSLIFKVLIFLLGLALLFFYGILFLAALVNLPASWFGFLYSSGGMLSGALCFIYFFRSNKLLLVVIIPFIYWMVTTLF